jgi:hypothetical protein
MGVKKARKVFHDLYMQSVGSPTWNDLEQIMDAFEEEDQVITDNGKWKSIKWGKAV